jgi:hypothetical protein
MGSRLTRQQADLGSKSSESMRCPDVAVGRRIDDTGIEVAPLGPWTCIYSPARSRFHQDDRDNLLAHDLLA